MWCGAPVNGSQVGTGLEVQFGSLGTLPKVKGCLRVSEESREPGEED